LTLISDLKKGKRGSIAKSISIMENDPKESRKLLKKIFKTSGKSIVIGITGPTGAGKSSLINKTVEQWISVTNLFTKFFPVLFQPRPKNFFAIRVSRRGHYW